MRTVDLILKKRSGQEHTAEELQWLIGGFTDDEVHDYQMSAWMMAVCWRGMTAAETAALTLAMAASGERLDLSPAAPFVVDKHSTGGVGDKTTLVVGPLVAAVGVPVGKMSGRGLGFSGGTIDKLESIPGFRAQLTNEEFIAGVRDVGLVVTAQSPGLAPADGKMYGLRDVTGTVESLPLIASSIMSKKIASGANGIMLDVKAGKGAFMKTREQAEELARAMAEIGREVGLQVRAVLSSMEQPLGHAVGNALEVQEAIATLRGEGPQDLLELALELGMQMLMMAGKTASPAEARAMLLSARESGAALAKLREFIANQGGDPTYVDDPGRFPPAPVRRPLAAERSGYVEAIDAEALGLAAVDLGGGRTTKDATIDYRVGLVLRKKVGDRVERGEPLLEIHADDEDSLRLVAPRLLAAYGWSDEPVAAPTLVLGVY